VVMGAIVMIDTPYALEMVALGESVFYVLFDVICFAYLRRRLGSFGMSSIVKTSIQSLAVGALGAGVGLFLGPVFIGNILSGVLSSSGIISALLQIIVGGVCALAITFGIASKLHMPGAQAIEKVFGKLRGRLHRA